MSCVRCLHFLPPACRPSRLSLLPVKHLRFCEPFNTGYNFQVFCLGSYLYNWTDSSFLVFPLKCRSLTRPQHSSSLCKVSWLLFVVTFCFYNTRVILLKCQGCSSIQSCLFIWFLCLSRTEAHRLFWESDETLRGFPRKVICNIGTNKFYVTCLAHGAPKPLCSLVLRAIDL